MAAGAGEVSMGCAKDLPVTNSAIDRRAAADCRLAIEIMGPDSMAASTRSGDMACRASRVGARSAPASWQGAQLRWYMLAPSSAETVRTKESKSVAQLSAPKTEFFIPAGLYHATGQTS